MRYLKSTLGGLLLAATVAAPAIAQDAPPPPAPAPTPTPEFTLTGNVGVVSDYRFRGLTQTNEGFAAQGSLNLNHRSGLYAGVWASSIDDDVSLPGYGGAELDLYAGYTRTFSNGVGVDVGLLYYFYPGGVGDTDWFEPYASISYTIGPVKAKVGGNYSWGGQPGLGGQDSMYLYASLDVGIPGTPLTAKGRIGRSDGSLGAYNLDPLDDNYIDWSLGLEATFRGHYVVGVQYVSTDITRRFGFADAIGADPTVVVYGTITF